MPALALLLGASSASFGASLFPSSATIIPIDQDGSSSSPFNETAPLAIDGSTGTKYLNFGQANSGFIIRGSNPAVVTGFQIFTANDSEERDPASYVIYGSNSALLSPAHSTGTAEAWTFIQSGSLSLPAARFSPGTAVTVTNTTAYAMYKVVFPSVKNGFTANSMQFSEIVFSGTVVTTAPEIAVEQPAGTSLTDGASSVGFGTVNPGSSASRTFTIKNTGNANLTGLGITINGADAAQFTVTASPTAPVSGPSGSTTFTVRFAPTSGGAKTAALHIASNDADENPFDITLTGRGNATPTVALNGPATDTLEAGATYSDLGATGADAEDGALTPVVTGAILNTKPGSYTLTYTVTDSGGLTASATRTVNVVDTTKPTLHLPANINAEAMTAAGTAVEYTVTATDLVSGDLVPTVTPPSGSVFLFGTTTVNVSATDEAGNEQTGSFTVTVTQANRAPVITAAPSSLTVKENTPKTFTVSASDADNNLTGFTFTGATKGEVSGAGPSFTYTPYEGATGDDSFVVTALDSRGATAAATVAVTILSDSSPALAGRYMAVLAGPNGAVAFLQVKLATTRLFSGNIRYADGQRLILPPKVISDEGVAAVTLKNGFPLTVRFDGLGHMTATLGTPEGEITSDSDVAMAKLPPALVGRFTAVLEAENGALGWLAFTISPSNRVRFTGCLPDGSTVSGAQGSQVDRDGEVHVMLVGNRASHPQLSGALVFDGLPTSDAAATLTWKLDGALGGCSLSGAKFTLQPSPLPLGTYPLQLTGAGIEAAATLDLLDGNLFVSNGVWSKFRLRPSSGIFFMYFRSPETSPLRRGSGVFQQKLGIGAGNFSAGGVVGNLVIGSTEP